MSEAKEAAASPSARPQTAHVLIVDDDPILVESLRELLHEEGYDVEGFTDARVALDHLLAGARPSLLLLDYVMPAMSGEQFLDELDAAGIDINVVLFTAMHESAIEQPASRVMSVVRKPFDLEPLLETIARIARD